MKNQWPSTLGHLMAALAYMVWIMEMCAQCICNMLTWLPTKVPLPTASSIDLILAGIHDIAMALHNPSVNSLLALLTNSQSAVLQQLMTILHGTTHSVAAPLQGLACTASSLRVPTVITMPAAPLRVPPATPPARVNGTNADLPPQLGPHLIPDDLSMGLLVTNPAWFSCPMVHTSSLMTLMTSLCLPAMSVPNARQPHDHQSIHAPKCTCTGHHACTQPSTVTTQLSTAMHLILTPERLQNTVL